LTIMHCQHVKGYLLRSENSSFLPHILQQQPHKNNNHTPTARATTFWRPKRDYDY
jgi:hypothetical protein